MTSFETPPDIFIRQCNAVLYFPAKFNSSKDYHKMKFYIQMLDYLRLLVLEYIELHQQQEETPKSAPD